MHYVLRTASVSVMVGCLLLSGVRCQRGKVTLHQPESRPATATRAAIAPAPLPPKLWLASHAHGALPPPPALARAAPDSLLAEEPSSATTAPVSLTASDGTGLKLLRLEASAVVQGPLAFTELHLTFENPEPRQLEGRFTIALPAGAAISRFAMQLPSGWQEAEVVERQTARRAYEDFLHRRQDPALLEHEAGNQFSARVFPIPPRTTKELKISYSQELVRADDQYRLPLVGLPQLAELAITAIAGDQVTQVVKRDIQPQRDFVIRPPSNTAGRAAGLRSDELLVARVRLGGDTQAAPARMPGLLVLFDTSASRAPGFATRVRELGELLASLGSAQGGALPIHVVCFDQTVETIYQGPLSGFGAAEQQRILRRAPLGASDLQGALAWVKARGKDPAAARLVILTDGVITAGAADKELGEAVAALKDAGTERLDVVLSGGIRDEAAMLALVSGHLPADGSVIDGEKGTKEVLRRLLRATLSGVAVAVAGARWVWPARLDGVQPGDELLVYAEFPQEAQAPTQSVTVSLGGALDEKKTVPLYPVTRPLLERALVRAYLGSLQQALSGMAAATSTATAQVSELRRDVTSLSTRFRVLSEYTALLVLETEDDYARFGIDRKALADILTVGERGIELLQRRGPVVSSQNQPMPDATMASLFGRDSALGPAADEPLGGLVGTKVGDSYGAGGFGLVGSSEGGGGTTGDGSFGLGNLGTIGRGAGAPTYGYGGGVQKRVSSLPGVLPGTAAVHGSLDKEVIRRIIRRHINEVKFCYERELTRAPTLVGRLLLQFTIGRDGAVVASNIQPSTMGSAPVEQCVLAAVRRWQFPRPMGGIVVVTYPFVFKASGDDSEPAEAPPPALPDPLVDSTRSQGGTTPAYTGKMEEVMSLLKSGQLAPAQALASKWRSDDAGDIMALVALGEVCEAQGDLAQAARAYGSVIDLFPSRADMRRFAGERLERLGESALPLAIDTFATALAQRPDHPASHRLHAYALLRKGDLAGAFAGLETGASRQYPEGRFRGVDRILREDLGLVGAAWVRKEPARRQEIEARLARLGAALAAAPSLRFVLNWETDANDVDFHIYDGRGGHAFFSSPNLPSGGSLYADVTTGYGPECFTIAGEPAAFPYKLEAHYYSRGPMGYGMGKLEIIAHDGYGNLKFAQRPFVVMNDRAFVDLGLWTAKEPL